MNLCGDFVQKGDLSRQAMEGTMQRLPFPVHDGKCHWNPCGKNAKDGPLVDLFVPGGSLDAPRSSCRFVPSSPDFSQGC